MRSHRDRLQQSRTFSSDQDVVGEDVPALAGEYVAAIGEQLTLGSPCQSTKASHSTSYGAVDNGGLS